MQYREFHRRFGGSYRTKNLVLWPASLVGVSRWIYRFPRERISPVNKPPYALPARSGIPREFIRLDPWEAEYLFMLASRARSTIVEIGRFNGGSTFLIACANDRVPIWSIDIDPQDDERLKEHLTAHTVGANLTLIIGDSQTAKQPPITDIDLLFIDGDHSY